MTLQLFNTIMTLKSSFLIDINSLNIVIVSVIIRGFARSLFRMLYSFSLVRLSGNASFLYICSQYNSAFESIMP